MALPVPCPISADHRGHTIQLFRRFLTANARISRRFDARGDLALYRRYDQYVAEALDMLPPRSTVLDVGGGRACSFAPQLVAAKGIRVIAVDISAEELAANTTAHATHLADVADRLPFLDASMDMVVSRTVLEHVTDVERAVHEINRVLRPGGLSIHLLPCRYALFAIVARRLPFSFAKRVLHTLIPESRGVVEFDVHYDRCHPSAMKQLFHETGFAPIDLDYTWDQAAYFHTLFPAFLLVLAYQRAAALLRLRRFASYLIIRARA